MANGLGNETFRINIFILDLNWFLFNGSMVNETNKKKYCFWGIFFEYANIVNSREIKKQ